MRTMGTTARMLTLALVASTLAIVSVMPTAHAGGPIGTFKVKGGLRQPAAFSFLPNGKIVYLERTTGQVHILNPKTKFDRRFFVVPGVRGTKNDERGALGVAVHPSWPDKPFIYVYATRQAGGNLKNQILRIKTKNGHGTGFTIVTSTPAASSPYHNGGRILFGPDGDLYAIVGDGHDSANAQDTDGNLRGKILRMLPNGEVPDDNPSIGGERSKIFAYGIRNSFGFAFDPENGDLWETENGPSCNDEINLIAAGDNYGWGPGENCPSTNGDGPNPVDPIFTYSSTIGITGATFCDGCGLGFQGDLFYGACCDGGSLHRAVLNGGRDDFDNVIDVMNVPGGSIFSMESAPDGRIYFSNDSAIYRLVSSA